MHRKVWPWSSQDTAGAFNSPLKLVVPGYRFGYGGNMLDVGTWGYYWSSSVSSDITAIIRIFTGGSDTDTVGRNNGFPVRCIKE